MRRLQDGAQTKKFSNDSNFLVIAVEFFLLHCELHTSPSKNGVRGCEYLFYQTKITHTINDL